MDLYLCRCVQIYVFVHNDSLVTCFYCYDELGPEPKPVLPGDTRTYRIWLDPNQYQQDMEKTAKGEAEDVYESLNVIMRRKPKENNFKVSLSHSRKSKRGICPLHHFAVTHGGNLQYLQTFLFLGSANLKGIISDRPFQTSLFSKPTHFFAHSERTPL